MKKNSTASLFISLSVLTGLVSAFVSPLMSYFLVDFLQTPPMYIGVYMTAVTLSGLVLSQWFGAKADNGSSARTLYLIATAAIITALLVFINTSSFVLVLLTGIIFMGIGNANMPQMLTISRQWAGQNKVDIAKFNGKVRAGISFAWMIGPPIGFVIVASFGFIGSFSLAIAFALLGMLFVIFYVPETSVKVKDEPRDKLTKTPLSFWLLALAIVMGSTGNTMYSSALPLYVLHELALPSYVPGVLMGLVACLEIPIMLLGSRLTKVISAKNLMLIAFVFAIIFYLGIFNATHLWQFIALQCINAIFYGFYAGVGLTFLQEELADRVGFTSAVYSNAIKIGLMFGTTGTGIIAQFSSFQYANLGAAMAAFAAIICMLLFSVLKKREVKQQANSQLLPSAPIAANG